MKGATLAAEGLGMLNLVKEINNKTKHLIGGKIKTHFDNKKVIKSMLNETKKESKCAQEASTTVEAIKRETKKVKTSVEIEHNNDKPRKIKFLNKNQDRS